MEEFVAYIDEAGDEGFGKLRNEGRTGQSRWLIMGALIVAKNNDRLLPSWRDNITDLFPQRQKRDLHFRDLDHNQRVAACRYLAGKPVGVCMVCSNKVTILDPPKVDIFKQKGHLYNYLVRFLLERITAAVKIKSSLVGSKEAKVRIVFSRRGGTDYHEMKKYLELMRDDKEKFVPKRSIDWDVLHIDEISVDNHSRWAGLQLADIVTSATYSALEPNRYGLYEPRYAAELADKFISLWGSRLDSGLTLIPPLRNNPLDDEQRKFVISLTKKSGQAPGS